MGRDKEILPHIDAGLEERFDASNSDREGAKSLEEPLAMLGDTERKDT